MAKVAIVIISLCVIGYFAFGTASNGSNMVSKRAAAIEAAAQ